MTWDLSPVRRILKPRHQRTIRNKRNYRPRVESLETRVAPANINITSFHYDPSIQGQDTQETDLTPLNVNSNLFGKLASINVDGYTYAQPLYIHGLMIGGVAHDVAFVATEHDSLYAFDILKNPTSGAVTITQLWQRSFINPAAGITTVPNADVGTGDIVPEIGITGGPVIDPATNVLYLVAKTKEVRTGDPTPHYVQKIYAIDITSATGADKTAPYTIGDTHGSASFANETTAIMVAGVGAENSGGANPMVPFSAFKENQRPSLQLLNGRVYVGWASHGDNGPYHGWVVGFNETTLQPEKIYCTNPNGGLAGIWQSEGALSTDGRYLYFATGNGGGAGGFLAWDPAHGNYSESVIKIDTQAAGTIMPVTDYFTPFNWQALDNTDADLGSGGVMLLPDSVGSAAHPHLMVETGKDGHIYLLDRDNMGQLVPGQQNNSQIVQDVVGGPGGVWGNPSYYQESATSGLIFYHGSGSDSRVFRVSNGQITQITAGNFVAYRSNQTFGFPGANPVISANGVNNPGDAIIWEVQLDNYGSQGPATLHAYALPMSGGTVAPSGNLTELYNSNQAGTRDRLSASVKFTSAIVTDGLVFVAQGGGPAAGNPASGTFNVFGEFAPPTQAPAAPTNLTAAGGTNNTILLNWTNPSPATGAQATAIKVFRSAGDDQHFGTTPITTISAGATSYTDTVSDPNLVYFYKLRASNIIGDSPDSNEASATSFVQPVLSLGNVASNAVVLSWTRPPVANNRFDVERSTTPNFASVTTVAAGLPTNTTSYTDNSAALVSSPGTYYYRIRAYSTAATTPFALSNVVGVKVGPQAGVINYGPPNGFPSPPAPSPFDLRANGDAQFAETTARLTNAAGQTGSVFSTSQENILNFTTTFNVRLHEGTQPYYANGFAFVIQAIGPNALGQGTTGLGYQGIPNSLALTFDTFTNGFNPTDPTHGGAVGLFLNGDNPAGTPGTGETRILLDPTTAHVNLDSQDTKTITLSYAYNAANPGASILHEVIVDTGPSGGTFTHDYTVNIPALLGLPANGNTIGYVGLTGSTGSIVGQPGMQAPGWEIQDILNWVYTPNGPAAPNHLTAVSGTSTNTLNWRTTSADDGPAPSGYFVERSTSQTTGFTRIATLGPGVVTYMDTGLTNPQQYFYRVQQFNHNGTGGAELDSGYSNVASGSVVTIPYGAGFADHSNLATNQLQAGPNIFGAVPPAIRITDAGGSEATSVWYKTPIGIGAFSTTFTLRDQPQSGSADSVSFVMQADARGTTALGAGGGAGGYGPGDTTVIGPPAIVNSVAIKFDLYTHGSHSPTTGLFTGGQAPAQFPAQDVPLTGINLGSGDPIQVTLTYDGTTLSELVTDTVTHALFTHNYSLNLAQTIGSTTAFVGFTGGTGGETANQDVLNWTGTFPQAPPQITTFTVSANPTSLTAGQTTQVTVTAKDQSGNTFAGYTGTVHFTSNDGQAIFANGSQVLTGNNYTFTAADMGVHTFTVTLKTAGTDSITATDTVRTIATGSTTVTVSPLATTSSLSVSGFPAVATLGTPGTFTVSATDIYGNVTPTYRGTVHLTSPLDPLATFANFDGSALTGNNYTFTAADNGSHLFRATLNTLGTQSITATDTVTGTINGTQSGINVQATPVTNINFPDFSNHGNLTANGNATFPTGTTVARLADGNNNESSSLFYNTLVGTGSFQTQFTFQMKAGSNPSIADGLTFVIQADPRGVTALGQGGGAMGYGTDANDGLLPAIQNSMAIKFDAYKGFNSGDGNHSSTGLYVAGHRPNNPPNDPFAADVPVDLAGSGIDFNASAQASPAHTFTVTLMYNGTTLTETIKDNTTNVTFTHNYTVNIGQVVGSSSAYVGFTAGTGGLNAFMDLQSWTGSFQQAGFVNINFADWTNTTNLTANTTLQSPPINVFPTTSASLNFPDFTNHSTIVTNGGANFTGTPAALQVTDGGGGEARSAWWATPVLAGNFTTTFTLQDDTNASADSLSFVMQADPHGTAALGVGGGGGGYQGITKSIAIKFDIWTNNTHQPTTGLFTNGQSPATSDQTPMGSQDVNLPDDILRSGHPITVMLTYNAATTTLTEVVTDTVSHLTLTKAYTVNLGAIIGPGPAFVGFTGGTGGATSIQKILNWTGTFVGPPSAMQLTDNRGNEATSVFYNTQVGVGPFSTSFTLQDTPTQSADSLSFVLQADPRANTALGAAGGGGGYSGINHSIAIKFDLWTAGSHAPTTGLFRNGEPLGTGDQNPPGSKDVPITGFPDLGSGHPLQVTLTYDGTTLTETIVDTVAHLSFVKTYTINLASVIGGNAAYAGFSAGTGGVSSTQKILNWNGVFSAPNATSLAVSAPAAAGAGVPIQITVSARDENNAVFQGYRGTVHFSSTDTAAGLPANYGFTAADNGSHTFTVTLNTFGSQTITVTDTATASLTKTTPVNVTIDYTNGFANNGGLQIQSSNPSNAASASFVGPNSNAVGIFSGNQNVGVPGDPGTPGSATFSNGTYTLTASGSDIWDPSDRFHYAYEALTGDGEIIARIVNPENAPDFWTKAGVMIRSDLTAGSANEFMMYTPNSGHMEPVQQWRDGQGTGNGSGDTGNHGTGTTPSVAVPIWVRLVRVGNNFSGFWATDVNGAPGAWQQMTTHTTNMPATVYVGLALTAHNNGATATATFDHVQVIGATAPATGNTVARLTDGGGSEAGSVFTKTKVPDTSFTTTFVLRDQPVSGAADSLSFVLQNVAPTALGGGGGAGGYQGINNSIAVKFDLYSGGTHIPTTGLYLNGASPGEAPGVGNAITMTGINLGSGDPLQVTLTYNGTTLTELVRDTITGATFTYDWLVNIAGTIGSNSAYAGFTAGTGGQTAIMDVQSWTYNSIPVPAVASLVATTATPNLVTNGGFETNDFTGWTLSGDRGDDGVFTGVAGTARVHSGTHAAHFGPGTLVFLTQSLATTPGTSYNLDFWLSNPIDGGGTGVGNQTELLVKVGAHGSTLTTLTDVVNAPRFNYTHYTFAFTATSSSTDLQFGFAHPPDEFYLDDVSVTPTTLTAGVMAQTTVTALDAGGHRVAYTGTVHITSTDPQIPVFGDYTFTPADNGQHVFTGTLVTAGAQTVTFRDTVNNSLVATTSIVVTSAAASTLSLVASPNPAASGNMGTIIVTAKDPFGNTATSYRGTVHLSSSTDPLATFQDDYTFTAADNGVHGFSAVLRTLGTQTVTATDTVTGSITGSASVMVVPKSFEVTGFPTLVAAGETDSFTVAAVDAQGNPLPTFTGTIHLSSTDPSAAFANGDGTALPGNSYTFTAGDAGTHTFLATLFKAGFQSISATQTDVAGGTGSESVLVTPSFFSALSVTGFPSPVVAGTAHTVTVTAQDAYGNTVTGFTDTVTISSSDSQFTPFDYTFTDADAGVHNFGVTLMTAGSQSITATDGIISGSQTGITVNPAASNQFVITTPYPSPITAGTAASLMLTVEDAFGNTTPGYTGTVHVTTNDGQVAPFDITFTAADAGQHFVPVTFKTAGTNLSITIRDNANPSLTASQSGIEVDPAAASKFLVTGYPATAPAGTTAQITVQAVDPFNNVDPNYQGTVHLSSDDANAVFDPNDYTFNFSDAGVHVFNATLTLAGTRSITATDSVTSSITGSQTGIVITPNAVSQFVVFTPYPSSVTAGSTNPVTIAAADAYGNIVPNYIGTVHVSSTDTTLTPFNYTFVAGDQGKHTFNLMLKTAGSQSLFFLDVAAPSINGEQDGIQVNAAAMAGFLVFGYPQFHPTFEFNDFTVEAVDQFGNQVTSYRGRVTLLSDDALTPPDYTFTDADNGIAVFTAAFQTDGTHYLRAQDVATASLFGEQDGIVVVG
jgi:hypothetical protein